MTDIGTLVLIRHGESRLNELNRFTGWLDVPLSKRGLDEAHALADHCENFHYDAAFTSKLERAHETLLIILSHQKRLGLFRHEDDERYHSHEYIQESFRDQLIPIYTTELLNERHYGDLQGLHKPSSEDRFGKEQIFKWRRGFNDRPPNGESLSDVYKRVIPYFQETVEQLMLEGKTVLISAHGNTLRSLIKHLEQISDEQISFIDLPTGHPLVYQRDRNGYKRTEGEYQFNRPLR